MSKRIKRDRGTRKKGFNDRKERKSKEEMYQQGDNDVTWYNRYPSLVQAASSIIFNAPYGHVENVIEPITTGASSVSAETSIPGLIAYKFNPMYVEDAAAESAVNIATKNLYTYIRHANSGAANYESSDLMQYLLTVLNLIVHVEQCKRDIRLVPTFNPLNKYIYTSALRANGYTDVNIATMRQTQAINIANLNQVIAQLNTFKIPKDLPLLDRHCWLVSNIWKDDELEKSSFYMFYTHAFAHYDWANRKVEIKDFGVLDLPGRIAKIQTEINNLLAYEDIGIMLGDILKAYKQEGCRIISPIGIGEVMDATYSNEALSQFTNAFVFGATKFDYDISQNAANSQLLEMTSTGNPAGTLVLTSQVSTGYTPVTTKFVLNPVLTVNSNQPSNDEVIISTRLMIAGTFEYQSSPKAYKFSSKHFPTEVILSGDIWYYRKTDNGAPTLTSMGVKSINYLGYNEDAADVDDAIAGVVLMSQCTKLDMVSFNPTLYIIQENEASGDVEAHFTAKFQGKNWITIDEEWLNRLTKGCKQSLYSLPMFKLLESN